MDCSELVKNDACPTDIQKYLAEGDATAITVRIPRNLRDAAKETAGYARHGIQYLYEDASDRKT